MPIEVQVIACEEKSLLEQQHGMTGRVSRCGNCQEIWLQYDRPVTIQDVFCIGLRRQFGSMNESLTAKLDDIACGIGDIVAMGQEHKLDSTPRLELAT